MFGLGVPELIIIAIIILFFFGAKRLPEIGHGLGKAISEFRKVKKEFREEKGDSKKPEPEREEDGFIENKISEKFMEKVPGAKQALEIKDKAEKIKKIMS
jgi:sec-independent protein translocase protein TatA